MSHCFPGTVSCSTWRRCGVLRPDGSTSCLHVKRYKEEQRERFLSPDEFNRLGRALDEILADGSETPRRWRRSGS